MKIFRDVKNVILIIIFEVKSGQMTKLKRNQFFGKRWKYPKVERPSCNFQRIGLNPWDHPRTF